MTRNGQQHPYDKLLPHCDRQPACPAWRLGQPLPINEYGHQFTDLDYGSSHVNSGAGGAKNPRVTDSYQTLDLATYNGRSLRLDEYVHELEVELERKRWYVVGLSEVRREGEDTQTLQSSHVFYYREGDDLSQGGVGFLVNRVLVNNIEEVSSVSSRVAYLVLRLTRRYTLKVIQVYAPTSTHSDDEMEIVYDDITKALHYTKKAHFTVVMGDFNARMGKHTGIETIVGPYGYGTRNVRGQMLVNFLEREGLFLMNSFFKIG